jgi:hypothetical protein
MGNVLNVGSHPVDLDNGRVLGHGEHAMSIDLDHPHNKAQVDAGHLRVIESAPVNTPRNPDGSTNAVASTTKAEVNENA